MFTGLTEDICQQAWELILPTINYAIRNEITNNYAGTIVVVRSETADEEEFNFFRSLPDSDPKYKTIAISKAYVSISTGLPSSVVQQQCPYLYEAGDTKWGGSTVMPGGVVVAFSGVQTVFDEMIAEMMASAIRGLCRWEMTKPEGIMDNESDFIGVRN